jgi:hypothetical protein
MFAVSPSALALTCECGDNAGGSLTCSGGCGCVSSGSWCECFCSAAVAAAPMSYVHRDFAKELAQRTKSPLAKALTKATLICLSKLKNTISVDIKEQSFEAADLSFRVLCERILKDSAKK